MNVLLVTTWNTECGIAEHSAMLKQYTETDDITIAPSDEDLDPAVTDQRIDWANTYDIVHLNYHAALHSRWTPEHVRGLQANGVRVVITYHDTYSGEESQPNAEKTEDLCNVADAFIVHEPVEDLAGAIYMRQGVLPIKAELEPMGYAPRWPMVGTCGFDFPWKNFNLLAEASREAGWGVWFVGGNLSIERREELAAINPRIRYDNGFVHRDEIVTKLSHCEATAFLYTCHNTGQSGAVCLGIAARKPVILMRGCRQFRCYAEGDQGEILKHLFDWTEFDVHSVTSALSRLRPSYHMHWLAEQDSWARLGQKYRELYQEVLTA